MNGLSVALVAVFCVSAIPAFNHNDFMYAVAPTLLGGRTLYDDVAFVQTPGSIWLYSAIFEIVPPEDFYLYLRGLSLVMLVAAGFLIFRTAAVFAGRTAAYLIPIFLCTSPIVLIIADESGNTAPALLLLSSALFVHFTKERTAASCSIVGLLIGLAALTKLNFALFAVSFGILIAMDRGLISRHVGWFVAAGLVGSAPIWVYLATMPERFWFFNIDFHKLTNLWREQRTTVGILTSGRLLQEFVWQSVPQLLLCGSAVLIARWKSGPIPFLAVSLVFITALSSGVILQHYSLKYLAPAAFLLALLSAMAARSIADRLNTANLQYWGSVFGVALIFAEVLNISDTASRLNAYRTHSIAPVIWQNMAQRIDQIAKRHLDGTACPRTTLSQSAIPFVGTSFSILPFSATGFFLPRIAARIDRDAPAFSRLADLDRVIQEKSPTVFLVGYYPESQVEKAIRRYTESTKFSEFHVGSIPFIGYSGPMRRFTLLVREACMTPAPSG